MISRMHRTRRVIRGLYGLADAGGADGDPIRVARALLDGGCRLLQLRCKGWPDDDVLAAARTIRHMTEENHATLLLNDRPHLVEAAGADGVHLGQRDVDTLTARRQMPELALVGRSTHNEQHIAAALTDADYIAFGPVWQTHNTDRDKGVRGLQALTRVRRAVPATVPLVAIGGITPERVSLVRGAGADSWAVIGAVRDAVDPVGATRRLVAEGSR